MAADGGCAVYVLPLQTQPACVCMYGRLKRNAINTQRQITPSRILISAKGHLPQQCVVPERASETWRWLSAAWRFEAWWWLSAPWRCRWLAIPRFGIWWFTQSWPGQSWFREPKQVDLPATAAERARLMIHPFLFLFVLSKSIL